MRHAFKILEELGAECDRLRVRVVDVHGETGPASDFLATVARYIEARENELHDRRWIPVTERLPEIGQIVVVFKRTQWGTFRGAGKYCKNLNGIPYVDVTVGDGLLCVFDYWMPFPDAPGDDK